MMKIWILSALLMGSITARSEPQKASSQWEKATFAGGCFWCMEPPFERLDGVKDAISGYMGGEKKNPTYKEVSSGATGHAEVVQVLYDPKKVSYKELLEVFWQNINPTDGEGQFVDRGSQYRPAIFYHSAKQKKWAEQSKQRLAETKIFKKPIATEVVRATEFYKAEDYHQDYYKTNTLKYKFYRYRSGRDQYLESVWEKRPELKLFQDEQARHQWKDFKKPRRDELKKQLSELQFRVTQEDDTEAPFENKYWDNNEPGIYVDVVSGEPLFSSKDKFKSGTGWPSFTRPIDERFLVRKKDIGFLGIRTEVRSKHGDSHLGHVFKDGPEPTGLRYCINSAALEFVPIAELKERGYEDYWLKGESAAQRP